MSFIYSIETDRESSLCNEIIDVTRRCQNRVIGKSYLCQSCFDSKKLLTEKTYLKRKPSSFCWRCMVGYKFLHFCTVNRNNNNYETTIEKIDGGWMYMKTYKN